MTQPAAAAGDGTGAARSIDALEVAAGSAETLGLDTAAARTVVAESRARLGLLPDGYVVALVGGTGVGKSTLLNSLAGEEVSPAGPRRPTTGAPVAWVPSGLADAARPLLDRLGVASVRTHPGDGLGPVVIVDLPDLDSLEPSHREIVEELLPRVDVVAWVTDPEKYADAALHDAFLRDWLPRLDRQAVILNKADRLAPGAVDEVARDLRRVIARDVPVLAVAARDGVAGIAPVRDWLAENVEAKSVVAARIAAAARAEVARLADAAGVTEGRRDLLPDPVRRKAVDAAVSEVARLLDMETLERHAVAATRARARRRGTGPVGILTAAIYRWSGRERAAANPAQHLEQWRTRGGLARVSELVRRAIDSALPAVPPALRPRYAAGTDARDLEARLEKSIDRMVGRESRDIAASPPSSRVWPFLGLLQSLNTVLMVGAVAWVVLWVLARPEVASWDLPILGPVPVPAILLASSLAAGYLLARLLGLHAARIGRRWARRLEVSARIGAREVIELEAFARIERLEAARARLSEIRTLLGAAPSAAPTSGR